MVPQIAPARRHTKASGIPPRVITLAFLLPMLVLLSSTSVDGFGIPSPTTTYSQLPYPSSSTLLQAYRSLRQQKKISLKKASQKLYNAEDTNAPLQKKNRRTRKRVSNPQQRYLYASQRDRPTSQDNSSSSSSQSTEVLTLAQTQFGYMVGGHCDPMNGGPSPRIMAEIRVDEKESVGTSAKAYILEKPPGWAILSTTKSKKNPPPPPSPPSSTTTNEVSKVEERMVQEDKEDQEDDIAVMEEEMEDVDMEAILAMMTPEERSQMEMDLEDDTLEHLGETPSNTHTKPSKPSKSSKKETSTPPPAPKAIFRDNPRPSLLSWLKDFQASQGEPIRIGKKYWTVLAGASSIEDSGLVLLCPKDQVSQIYVNMAQYTCVVGNGGKLAPPSSTTPMRRREAAVTVSHSPPESTTVQTLSKLRKGRGSDTITTASVRYMNGGSYCQDVVMTVQDYFQEGVRGDVMGDPLDVRAPRRLIHCDSMSVSSLSYEDDKDVTLLYEDDDVGEDEKDVILENDDDDDDENDNEGNDWSDFEDEDEYYMEDTTMSGEDTNDEHTEKRNLRDEILPNDIAIWTHLGQSMGYHKGSFHGRSQLGTNDGTTAYREINGVADGYPGWIVDRYGKWLFIQHDESESKGPVPSIHDGYTSGVYLFGSTVNRADIGHLKPQLYEGKAAPEHLVIEENGVKYIVNLDERLSTGIFLDQRLQRDWITNICNDNTRVLNCFAHCGAYSVAAATAGASTVSLDLEKRWLDRVEPQMRLNGITDFEERHDCVYGDCK